MSVAAARTPAQYEERLQRYVFERSEEARVVRVGEKETSEQAAIVERYADLFTREQIDVLREAEDDAEVDERERLYRLRKACESGIVTVELAEREDELENAILAAGVTFRGEEMPLRNAQAKLAVLDSYADREELGEIHAQASARFNDDRLELLRAGEEPVRRRLAERRAVPPDPGLRDGARAPRRARPRPRLRTARDRQSDVCRCRTG